MICYIGLAFVLLLVCYWLYLLMIGLIIGLLLVRSVYDKLFIIGCLISLLFVICVYQLFYYLFIIGYIGLVFVL